MRLGGRLKFSAWFVTNSRKIPKFDQDIIDDDFAIMTATLPKNWLRMDGWRIVSLTPYNNAG